MTGMLNISMHCRVNGAYFLGVHHPDTLSRQPSSSRLLSFQLATSRWMEALCYRLQGIHAPSIAVVLLARANACHALVQSFNKSTVFDPQDSGAAQSSLQSSFLEPNGKLSGRSMCRAQRLTFGRSVRVGRPL